MPKHFPSYTLLLVALMTNKNFPRKSVRSHLFMEASRL